MCYSIYSYVSAFKNTGSVNIYTGLNSSYAIEAVNLIKTEISKFSKNGISNEKLIKAKEQLKGNYILGLESTSSRMFNNGKSLLFLSVIKKPSDIIKKIDNINAINLLDVMERTFAKGIQNSAFVGDNIDVNALINTLEGDVIAYKNHESKRI